MISELKVIYMKCDIKLIYDILDFSSDCVQIKFMFNLMIKSVICTLNLYNVSRFNSFA